MNPAFRPKPSLIPGASIIYKEKFSISDVEALAFKLEGKLAKAVLSALIEQAASVSIDAIAEALIAGDVGKVLALLDLPAALAPLSKLTPAIQDGLYAAGGATAAGMFRPGQAQFVFNRLNPRLINWLNQYSLGLIREINTTTKEGIRQYLVSGMNAGKGPKQVATEVKGIIGLTNRQAQAVKNFRSELETMHTRRSAGAWGLGKKPARVNGTQVSILDEDGANADGVNHRRLRDFRFDGQVSAALQSGKPLTPAQIDRMVKAYERKYLAYRARTIGRTEALRTTNVGVQDAWQQAIDTGRVSETQVRRQWIVARDERLCESCGPIPRLNPKIGVKHGQPFATPDGPQFLPPLHPNCRCTVFIRQYEPQQIAAAEAKAGGNQPAPPPPPPPPAPPPPPPQQEAEKPPAKPGLKTFSVEYEGQTYTRSTRATYTHVMIARQTPEAQKKFGGKAVMLSWSSSAYGAQTKADQYIKSGNYEGVTVRAVNELEPGRGKT